uniref:Uncharacterized protein n=1 Tax=Rhizophora mucronata TaxID=61149 RepID=A0A2P2L4M9_RHIMU
MHGKRPQQRNTRPGKQLRTKREHLDKIGNYDPQSAQTSLKLPAQ